MNMNKTPISVVLIVRNEEDKIELCLKALEAWVSEIIVVDSGSEDRTCALAARYTPHIFQRTFDHYAAQKNFAISKATQPWVLSLDADEIVTPELADEIQRMIQSDPPKNGFYLMRHNRIFGKYLKYGGQGPEKILRLFRRGTGRFEQPIHEFLVVEGEKDVLDGALLHFCIHSVGEYVDKLQKYTDFEAEWLYERKASCGFFQLYLHPFVRFVYYYGFRLGFLDGYEGFLYQALSSFYYFLKQTKLREKYQSKAGKGL